MSDSQILGAINAIGTLGSLEVRVRGDDLEYPDGSGNFYRSGETLVVDGPFAAWRICLRLRYRRWPGFEPTDPKLLSHFVYLLSYIDQV
jgi:hypothetical protein